MTVSDVLYSRNSLLQSATRLLPLLTTLYLTLMELAQCLMSCLEYFYHVYAEVFFVLLSLLSSHLPFVVFRSLVEMDLIAIIRLKS